MEYKRRVNELHGTHIVVPLLLAHPFLNGKSGVVSPEKHNLLVFK